MEIEIRLWYYTVQYIQCCMRWEDESFEKEKKKKKHALSSLFFYKRWSVTFYPSYILSLCQQIEIRKEAQMLPRRDIINISPTPLSLLYHSISCPVTFTIHYLIQHPPQRLKHLSILPLLPRNLHRLHDKRIHPRKMLPAL